MNNLLSFFADTAKANCANGPSNPCETNLPKIEANSDQLQTGLTIVFASLAAVSVLMMVVAGLRFITAQGNPQEIAKARKTIIYSAAGLAIALSAEGIVALALGGIT